MVRATFPQLNKIPKEHINDVYNYLMDMNTSDSGFDFQALILRPVFSDRLYPLVLTIFSYALLVIFGLFGNGTVFYVIWKKGSYKKYNTLACVLNITLAFFIQILFVIPLTLFVIVVDNWVMGSALCHLLPMIQDVPGYSLMMTITIMSYERRRFLSDPRKGSMPVRWAIGFSWIISIALVLPYIGYIVFIDLSVLGPEFVGGQICIISLPGKASTYIKTLFVFFYAIPMLTSIAFLRRTSKIIRQRELEQYAYRNGGVQNTDYVEYNRYYGPRYWYNGQQLTDYANEPNYYTQQPTPRRKNRATSDAQYQVDVQKEKRSQKFLYLIIITYFICLFPLNVLKLVRQLVMETYDNARDFDVTYTIIVWVAFLPTVLVPWYFAQWIFLGDDLSKETFRFYLSNKSDSVLTFPGLSEPPCDPRGSSSLRTPTPPPPPGHSHPKKIKMKKKKASRSSSSSSFGYAQPPQNKGRPLSYRCSSNGKNVDYNQCTCGFAGGTWKHPGPRNREEIHQGARKKETLLHSYENGIENTRRHSYHHLKFQSDNYQTLGVPNKLKKRPNKNWNVSMVGLSATQV